MLEVVEQVRVDVPDIEFSINDKLLPARLRFRSVLRARRVLAE